MSALAEPVAQGVQAQDGGLAGAIQDVEDSRFVRLAIQGHLEHVEREFIQCGCVAVERISKSPPSVFVLILKQEVEEVHEATIATPDALTSACE
jgi:hypothetical protein